MSSIDVLNRPFSFKGLHLKNRIVMAPMTRDAAKDGIPGPDNTAYYRRRAEAQVGLILTEGTVIARPAARNQNGIPFFHGEQALAGWKQVADAVHQAGGCIGPQLWHVGSVPGLANATSTPLDEVESPSGLVAPGNPRGKAMTEQDIADTIATFASAAKSAVELGFDTLELHGAHGYLIDQFFWQGTNQRTDQWGGASIEARNRFAVEVIKAVRQAIGPDFPLIMRLSQWKAQDYKARLADSPDAMTRWLQPLIDAGVDILHCSQRRFWEPEFPEVDGEQGLNFAGWAKKLTGAATISVGSVSLSSDFMGSFKGENSQSAGIDQLLERMERDEFDLIAVGRALISNPDWANKVLNGQSADLRDFSAADLKTLA